MLQAKADRLSKQLQEQQESLTSCSEQLEEQHAQQMAALQMQLDKQVQEQVRLLHCPALWVYSTVTKKVEAQLDDAVTKFRRL